VHSYRSIMGTSLRLGGYVYLTYLKAPRGIGLVVG
jgi:hypothetical protein